MRHGARGAAELAETVDRLVDFAETTGAVSSVLFDLVHEAYLADAHVRDFLLRENPEAARAIAERLETARRKGLWHPRRNDLGAGRARALGGGSAMTDVHCAALARACRPRWRPATGCWCASSSSGADAARCRSAGSAPRRARTATARWRSSAAAASRSAGSRPVSAAFRRCASQRSISRSATACLSSPIRCPTIPLP